MFTRLLFLFSSLLLLTPLRALDASLSFARFSSPGLHYVEIYLHLAGQSVTYQPLTDSTMQAAVDVLILFEQAGEIVKYDHYRLNSPVAEGPLDFLDLKRYALDDGDYTLAVLIEDAADSTNVREYRTDFRLAFSGEEVEQSDIQLLASVQRSDATSPMVKNGILMEPLPYQFYGRGVNVLSFYEEIYGSDTYLGADFMVSYHVQRIRNGEPVDVLIGHKRLSPAPVVPVLLQVDISQLVSGNYQLVVDVRDRERQLISTKRIGFQRSNPLVDAEYLEETLAQVSLDNEFVGQLDVKELRYALLAITPHLPQGDVSLVNAYLRDTSNLHAQRMYLFSFWARERPADPASAYFEYMEVAQAVDRLFQSGFRNGFETDRGYVYLKYGQPDDIVRNESEPTAPPYEIWSYNKIDLTNQNNVRFIFYNPTLAAEDFVLLHSDVIGERQNPQWQMELYRDSPNDHPDDYFMGLDVQDNIGRRASRLLRDY
ncbi:MAG: GWxTD domain-containing protein [Lewinella sp.]|nr:GWxTD domain-containing protein [Lewinella sp.]